MEECSSFILAMVIDFMYDIKLPAELSFEDAKAILTMADFYLIEDLKDAVGSLIADKYITENNILEMSQTAEKYTATKLRERCCEFIFSNHASLDKKLLAELYKALPNLRKMALEEVVSKGRPVEGAADILKKVLGIDLTQKFKKRVDFQSEDDHTKYVMANIKPNMLVLHNTRYTMFQFGPGPSNYKRFDIPIGALGRVEDIDFTGKSATVKWFIENPDCPDQIAVDFDCLDLHTNPITIAK